MRESFQKLQEHLEKVSALGAALALFSWDSETLAPKKAAEYTSKAVGILSGEMFGALINDTTKECMARCEQEKNPDVEHLKKDAEVAYYLASGERAVETCQKPYLKPVCESGRTAYEALTPIENKNEDNTKAVELLTTQLSPARPDISADLGAKAIKIEDEVIIPKFQGLLAGEVSPEEMYQAIVDAAYDTFGEEGCVQD